MLKDKSCYATESAYALMFFIHKSSVQDHLIDPVCGSFIRVVTPHPEQPIGNGGWYTRPQFMIMSRAGCSRMHELKDIETLFELIAFIKAKMARKGDSVTQIPIGSSKAGLLVYSNGAVEFKKLDGTYGSLISAVSKIKQMTRVGVQLLPTVERQFAVTNNLQLAISNVAERKAPVCTILEMCNEMMMTVSRPDHGVREPIIVSCRQFEESKETFIVVKSAGERLVLPTEGAALRFAQYFDRARRLSEVLLRESSTTDQKVAFIEDQDENMEYVHCRTISHKWAKQVYVSLNSERVMSSTKFGYYYDAEFNDHLSQSLQIFADKAKGLGLK